MDLVTKHAELQKLRPLAPAAVRSLAAAWDVRMVYESNSIEGNTLTLRETEIVLSKGVTVSGKPLKDHLEAVNLSKAWDSAKALAQPGAVFTERTLLELHRIILAGVDDFFAGSFRTSAVRIAGASLVPPNSVKVPDLVADLFASLATFSDPVERAARLHHGIAAIHPFSDGNGRSARLAMNFILLSAGYHPISIPPKLSTQYYAALEAADSGDFQTWLDFISKRLDEELDLWLNALSEPTPNAPL